MKIFIIKNVFKHKIILLCLPKNLQKKKKILVEYYQSLNIKIISMFFINVCLTLKNLYKVFLF